MHPLSVCRREIVAYLADATPHQLYMLQFGPSISYGTLPTMIPDHRCYIKV